MSARLARWLDAAEPLLFRLIGAAAVVSLALCVAALATS